MGLLLVSTKGGASSQDVILINTHFHFNTDGPRSHKKSPITSGCQDYNENRHWSWGFLSAQLALSVFFKETYRRIYQSISAGTVVGREKLKMEMDWYGASFFKVIHS